MEGFFGRLKTKLAYPRQWQAATIEQFIQELNSCIRWYNESVSKFLLAFSARSNIERASNSGITQSNILAAPPANAVWGDLRC